MRPEELQRLQEEAARLSNWAFGIGAAVVVVALVAWAWIG